MKNQKILDWYNREIQKDEIELEYNKKKIIASVKKIKKENLFQEQKKPSLWTRIKKVLMGI